MTSVTVSSRGQVVIPHAVRKAMGLEPGMKLQVVHYNDRVELIPVRPRRSMRGFLRGIDSSVPREGDRE